MSKQEEEEEKAIFRSVASVRGEAAKKSARDTGSSEILVGALRPN